MTQWKMLTVVGRDRPGIVAAITQSLLQKQANLGEAAMQRLGGNFTIMLMVDYAGDADELLQTVQDAIQEFGLQVHIDNIEADLHSHIEPNRRVMLYGADRVGIVAQATALLAQAGMHILELRSDVAGTSSKPIYVLEIDGYCEQSEQQLRELLQQVDGLETRVESIDTMIA